MPVVLLLRDSRLGVMFCKVLGFPGGSDGKAATCNAGDPGSIPGSGRSPGEGNGTPLQYPYLENPMDREAWWATVHGVEKSWTRLSNFTSLHFIILIGKGEEECMYLRIRMIFRKDK